MNSFRKSVPQYETSDLNLASFLRCHNFAIRDILQREGRTVFAFEQSPELHAAVLRFANDGPVPARTFCNTLRDLKGLIRSNG